MRYSGGLSKKEREQIFSLFVDKRSLKFSQIEKAIKIRSNLVAYHLDRMRLEGLIKKDGEKYSLTPKSEKFIPIFPHIVGKDPGPLAAVLVAVVNKGKILLLQRNKRPYQGYWGMVGGRINHSETIIRAATRLVNDKAGIRGSGARIKAVMHEQVNGDGIVKHSFILFMVTMESDDLIVKDKGHGTLEWFSIKQMDRIKMIPSDLWLIRNKMKSSLKVIQSIMDEKEGEIHSFRITE